MERLLDIGARRLGLDPVEVRRRNLVRPGEMPYRSGLTYKDGVPIAYDPGDFPAAFERALELVRLPEYRARQAASGAHDAPHRCGRGLLRAGLRARPLRGRRGPRRPERHRLRDRRGRRPGPGAPDDPRPDLRRRARGPARGRRHRGRRHGPVPDRHGHGRQPRRGQHRARRRPHRARGAGARPGGRRGAPRVRARGRADRGGPRLRRRGPGAGALPRPGGPRRDPVEGPPEDRRARPPALHVLLPGHRHVGVRHPGGGRGGRSRNVRDPAPRLRGGARQRAGNQPRHRRGSAPGRRGAGHRRRALGRSRLRRLGAARDREPDGLRPPEGRPAAAGPGCPARPPLGGERARRQGRRGERRDPGRRGDRQRRRGRRRRPRRHDPRGAGHLRAPLRAPRGRAPARA